MRLAHFQSMCAQGQQMFYLFPQAEPETSFGFEVCQLQGSEVNSLALPWLREHRGEQAAEEFLHEGLPAMSIVARQCGEVSGICLVQWEPGVLTKAQRENSGLGLAFSERPPICIVGLGGSNPDGRGMAVLYALKFMRALGYRQFEAAQEYREVLERQGASWFASRVDLFRKDMIEVLLSQGRPATEAFPDQIPQYAQFLNMRLSRNRLYVKPLVSEPQPVHSIGVPLQKSDVPALAAYHFQVFGDGPKFLEHFLGDGRFSCSFVVHRKGQPVAAVLIGGCHYPVVNSIYVCQEYRRRGWAARLLEQALCRLREEGEKVVVAHIREANTPSSELFLNAGFRRVQTLSDLIELGRMNGVLQRREARLIETAWSEVEEACRTSGIGLL